MYLVHRTIDKCNIIVDARVTKGNVYDSDPFIERAEYIKNKFGFELKKCAVDFGNLTLDIKNILLKTIYLECLDIEDIVHQNQKRKKVNMNITRN